MSLLVSLYAAILFFVLVPGVLLSIPRRGSKLVVAAVHALVFGLVYHFTHKLVWRLGASLEGFEALEVSAPKENMKENMEKEKEKEEKEE
jgi:hypothetical protein